MRIGTGEHTYDWNETWATMPNPESAKAGWSHHGIVVTEAGKIITLHQGTLNMMEFDPNGTVERSWELGLTEAHGITLVKEGGTEYLWIADPGRKRTPETGFQYPDPDAQVTGQVVKTTLTGETTMSLEPPPLSTYRDGDYLPTWVAVNEERNGGNGDVWVADGYGQNYVHRYDKNGGYIASINGEEGPVGAFDQPHAIFVDTRKSSHELYVSDRGNDRVQVYDLEGKFKKSFGSDFLTTPTGFAIDGDLMIIAELNARLTIVDLEDKPVSQLGDNHQVADTPGWPNNHDEDGKDIRTSLLEPGKFNSPHGMAVDANGNIYVAEWLIGGRMVKLTKS